MTARVTGRVSGLNPSAGTPRGGTPVLKVDRSNFDMQALQPAVECLAGGGVIAYPTETVYGLGCDVFRADALERIFAIKGRRAQKQVAMMIGAQEEIERYCAQVSDAARKLMRAFWPGPLMLVFEASAALPAALTGDSGTVGVRFPDDRVCRALVKLLGKPIVSTSANESGKPPASDFSSIPETVARQLDLLMDGGRMSGTPSTVIDVTRSNVSLLRQGALPFETVQKILREP